MLAKTKTELKPGQKEVYDKLLEFINDDNPSDLIFTLSGAAGTGKTYITQYIIVEELNPRDVIVTAPTNKAKKVIASRLPDSIESMTIHSLLGLKIKYNFKTGKEELTKAKDHRFDEYPIIFVDECSMVDSELYDYIVEACVESDSKVIFVGDKFQLPPVNESDSLTLNNIHAELTEIVRQQNGNPILELVTCVRENIEAKTLPLSKVTNYDQETRKGYIYTKNKNHFIQSILTMAKESYGKGPDSFKVIAWRNKTVESYNQLIRSSIYGTDAKEFVKDEWLLVTAPGDKTELYRSDDIQVLDASLVLDDGLDVWHLKVMDTDGDKHYLRVVAKSSQEQFWNRLKLLAEKKIWKQYFAFKESFDFVDYSYAITAHKSQGSTYESVFVDDSDIFINKNVKERNQMAYVAYSRASDRLMIYSKYAGG